MATGWGPTLCGLSLAVLWPGALEANRAGAAGPVDQIGVRVRTNDIASASLLEEALRRSPTIRQLEAEIQTSDVVVMLALTNDQSVRGRTQFSSAHDGVRIVITRISTFLIQDERLAVLGHELQHVGEIAAAPEVRDEAAIGRLFERIGDRTSWSRESYETTAAIEIERRVLNEVQRVR
ncbi:MAG TPA: hypothetical protein VES67_02220 [Vicinamibacterales bacterium]|nr:hypothetical protein [Vicinamibacterales bacterium]